MFRAAHHLVNFQPNLSKAILVIFGRDRPGRMRQLKGIANSTP